MAISPELCNRIEVVNDKAQGRVVRVIGQERSAVQGHVQEDISFLEHDSFYLYL